jgi:hypothetical protein
MKEGPPQFEPVPPDEQSKEENEIVYKFIENDGKLLNEAALSEFLEKSKPEEVAGLVGTIIGNNDIAEGVRGIILSEAEQVLEYSKSSLYMP